MSYSTRFRSRIPIILAPKIASNSQMNLRIIQAVRNESTSARYSIAGRCCYLSPSAGRDCLNQGRIKLTNRTLTKDFRHYSTQAEGSGSRVGKFAYTFLKTIFWSTGLLVFIVSGSGIYLLSQYPQLRGWPVELRNRLKAARISLESGLKGPLVEQLSSAWKIIKDIPMEALNPDPPAKTLSVAEWLADALEKDNQASKAYNLLVEAIELYERRFQESNSASGQNTNVNAMDDVKLAEKRHLISIFCKLATLSDKCEPGAEGRWLSRAVLEMVPLLPLCKESYKGVSLAALVLAESDVPASGLLKEIGAQIESSLDISNTKDSEQSSKSETSTTIEYVNDDDALPLPKWYLSDVSSAIAVPLELVGLYAERHDRTDVAFLEYDAAASTLENTAETLDDKVSFDRLVQVLRIRNHSTSLQIRLLESETDPTQWLYRLHKVTYDSLTTTEMVITIMEKLKILSSKDGRIRLVSIPVREAETLAQSALECAIAMRHAAIRMEKLGELGSARANLEKSLVFLSRAKYENARGTVKKLAAESIKSVVDAEEKRLDECINSLNESIKERKTSVKSHMNRQALEEWKRIKQARLTRPEQTESTPQS